MKLNKILPISLLGCSLPTMTMVPTSCKEDNNKKITQAQWADAFAYFDFNNKDSNYKIDITLDYDVASPGSSQDGKYELKVDSIGLNKYIVLTDLNNPEVNNEQIWLERNEYFDYMYSYDEEKNPAYPGIDINDTFDDPFTAASIVFCYVIPLWYDPFVYNSSTNEYTWTMIECEYGLLKFTDKFTDDAKLSSIDIKLLLDLGGYDGSANANIKFTYGDASIPVLDKSKIPNKDFIYKELDQEEPRTKISYKIDPAVVFDDDNFGIVKIVNPATGYRVIKLVTEQQDQKFYTEGGEDNIAIYKNGEKLVNGTDYQIYDTSIVFNYEIKTSDTIDFKWNLDDDQEKDFAFVLDDTTL